MKNIYTVTFFFFLFSFAGQSQDSISTEDMMVDKDFLILLSTKDYKTALATAKKASASTQMTLDLRGLSENKSSGLTLSKAVCKEEDIEYPSYYAWGREDGIFISIEYSNAYKEFAKGYYIVVAASGEKKDPEMQNAYKKIRARYKDAYFKSSKVYVGCMH